MYILEETLKNMNVKCLANKKAQIKTNLFEKKWTF